LSEKKLKENEDWEKFISCNTKYDVTRESDLTTFLTEYKEYHKCLNEKDIINDLMASTQKCEDVSFFLY
jgi:hypothetical protein